MYPPRDGADVRFFDFIKIAKMTQNDLLTLTMVSSEPLRKIFTFLKFIIFVEIERKYDFNGNNATYDS